MDRRKGNEILNSPTRQLTEETPTNIKSVTDNGTFVSTRESQVYKGDWRYTTEAMSHTELMRNTIAEDVFVNWKINEILDATETQISNLPKSITTADVRILKVEDFTGIATHEKGINSIKRSKL